MPMTRRGMMAGAALVAVGAGSSVAAAPSASAEPFPPKTVGTPAAGRRAGWLSGVSHVDPDGFGAWRGSTVAIYGMFGDVSVEAQLEQYQYTHSTFGADLDLAVGGPIDVTWAEVAAGAQVDHWKAMAATLRDGWHYRTVFIRYAHEANGTWMKWSVKASEVAAFRAAFRLFRTTMLAELAGYDVKFVFAPNFGSWSYTPDSMWPGDDAVDVVGLSIYEWADYSTAAKWAAFAKSSLGPDYWAAVARRHGKPLGFSEWGGRSAYFIKAMRNWMATHSGTGAGQLLYDVYLDADEFVLTPTSAAAYRSVLWGR